MEAQINKKWRYQVGMFCLCYFTWAMVHCQREYWAMSKKVMKHEHPELTKTFFGYVDTSLFMNYALAQFFTGMIGDAFDKRRVLALSFTMQAFFFLTLAYYAHQDLTSLLLLCAIFSGIGLIQSVDFPCLIGTLGAWTQRKNRGMITGFWATCNNVGNIFGLQTAAVVLNFSDDAWEYLMIMVFLMYLALAALIFKFFVADPRQVGLEIAEVETGNFQLQTMDTKESQLISRSVSAQDEAADDYIAPADDEGRITFCEALCAPNVILYGFCFAGTKLGVYAMMLWMPMYLKEVTGATNSKIANIQTLYEVGAVLGTVVLGYISDKYHARRSPIAITAMSINTLIALSFFFYYDSYNFYLWLTAMFCFGFFLGSIHHIICCCCTADLGRLHTKQATSTITGIIDGIGSGGSGLGQMLLGYLIQTYGWRYGFFLPITISIAFVLVPLLIILKHELKEINSLQ